MSEKSLDDFFAKKDKVKKNKKNKAKFTTSHEIAKKLTSGEEPRKNQKKTEKDKKNEERSGELVIASEIGADIAPLEEWKEEEQKEVDYSDLKIQALQVSEEPVKAEGDDGEEEEFDEFGEPIKSKSQVPAGPWNVAAPTESETTDIPEQPPQPEPVREELANVKGGVYVPPSRRNVSASTPTQSSQQRSRVRGRKKAPEISCQQEFPSLAASADILKYSDKRDERTFETVTRGVPKSDGGSAKGPNLQLDNRYSALDRN